MIKLSVSTPPLHQTTIEQKLRLWLSLHQVDCQQIAQVDVHAGHNLQCRSKANITGGGGARERLRRKLVGGSGGMLAEKILKYRGLEMLFPAFSKSYL